VQGGWKCFFKTNCFEKEWRATLVTETVAGLILMSVSASMQKSCISNFSFPAVLSGVPDLSSLSSCLFKKQWPLQWLPGLFLLTQSFEVINCWFISKAAISSQLLKEAASKQINNMVKLNNFTMQKYCIHQYKEWLGSINKMIKVIKQEIFYWPGRRFLWHRSLRRTC